MSTRETFDLPAMGSPEWMALAKSLQQLHNFLDRFSAEDMQRRCWELVCCAFGSEEADTWTHFDRSTMLFFYDELTKLGRSLPVINKHVSPLLVVTEE